MNPATSDSTPRPQADATRASILIVEDNPIIAEALRTTLEKLGYDAQHMAASGRQAIELADRLRLDLALIDIRLSGAMDGIEAATILHDRFSIPVVYITAHCDAQTARRARLTGPYGFLIKPVDPLALQSTVEMALYKCHAESLLRECKLRNSSSSST